ncbi:PREDICTED: putative uncharacterized protein DDB_G0287113 [Amphimedon queenslandica]|uniref:Uncharacterized protein n=1 Tax=Amphimedon queenslandica TaxID=400682 RepID=A0AAN0J714_AMPQE|nr:PREDICTED: putative uncharacterized protein DDB_G0287113 [Amphimedon queenslandica]|eukprot:XP_019852552.1 PREDICTED: putative uncharacterized protein DDB_G0287113 [Amphimedon queenslandica]
MYEAKLIKESYPISNVKGETLLDEIQEAVCINYRKLKPFAEILCTCSITIMVGRAIKRDYRKVYGSDDENIEGLKIYLPNSITSKFKSMRLKFGQAFINVRSIMMSNHQSQSIDDIKRVLGLQLQLARCEDIRSILQLIHDESSLDDISLLEHLVNKLNIDDAKIVIEDYKGAIEELKMKLRQFLKGELSKALSLIQYVTIVVDKDTNESVLKDVKKLSSAVLPHYVKLNVIRLWDIWKQKSFTDTYVDPTVQSKDTTVSPKVSAGTTESVSHSYQEEEENTDNEDEVMLLQEKVKRIQKQLEEEKELHEKEKQLHKQAKREYEEEILQQKREVIQNEERIATLTELHEEVIGLLKLKGEQNEELKSDNELTHKQLEKEKEDLQRKIHDLQQELEQVSVHCNYTITQSELQSEIQKIKNENEIFQKQRKALILENERLMSLLKEYNGILIINNYY